MRKLGLLVLCLAAAAAAPGCATVHPGTAEETSYADLAREEGWVLLDGMEHVPQQTLEDCGAAALSMVLARWGVDAPAEELHRECAVPGEEGLRAVALRDAARRRGLKSFVIAGNFEDLEHELARGRPVMVGLVKTAGGLAASHYEVVVGLHRDSQKIAALDPARGLVCDSMPAFAGEWAATNAATVVVFRPEAKPETRGAGSP